MNLKNAFSNIFKYTPEQTYNFSIIDDKNSNTNNQEILYNDKTSIFSDITKNLNYIKTIYNTLINSDIVLRNFTLIAKNKKYSAFLLYIDGMVDSQIINDFILKTLMLKNKSNTFYKKFNSTKTSSKITVKQSNQKYLTNYIYKSLIPQNNIEKSSTFSEIISGVNSGNCALFVDTLSIAFNIDVKGFNERSVSSPSNEVIIKGPQEAFVENIRTNTALIRKVINNENLIIENLEVGKISKTKCAVCYMNNITNNNLVSEVKFRINNLSIDSLLSSGQLEQLIEDSSKFGIPQILSTERPDKCTKYLIEGRVVVLVNGNPDALIMPATLSDFMSSPEDTNLKTPFANFLKALRFISAALTLLLPGVYIAITSFHQEILPTELLFSILAARQYVPFPIIFELLIMEISFELIREAGLRVPSPVGPTIRNCRSFNIRRRCSKCKHCKSNINYCCGYNWHCISCNT